MALDETLVERLEATFPYYLNAADRAELIRHIGSFPDERNYFANSWEGPETPIQGDGWNGFTRVDFMTSVRTKLAGIVLSNSCDIDEDNASLRNRNVVFAPLERLSDYEQHLTELGAPPEKIRGHLEAIRQQRKSEIFYLPASQRTPETIVQFDNVSAQPLQNFSLTRDREKLFRLNPFGFYVFLMKLSNHFTRFGEELQRGY